MYDSGELPRSFILALADSEFWELLSINVNNYRFWKSLENPYCNLSEKQLIPEHTLRAFSDLEEFERVSMDADHVVNFDHAFEMPAQYLYLNLPFPKQLTLATISQLLVDHFVGCRLHSIDGTDERVQLKRFLHAIQGRIRDPSLDTAYGILDDYYDRFHWIDSGLVRHICSTDFVVPRWVLVDMGVISDKSGKVGTKEDTENGYRNESRSLSGLADSPNNEESSASEFSDAFWASCVKPFWEPPTTNGSIRLLLFPKPDTDYRLPGQHKVNLAAYLDGGFETAAIPEAVEYLRPQVVQMVDILIEYAARQDPTETLLQFYSVESRNFFLTGVELGYYGADDASEVDESIINAMRHLTDERHIRDDGLALCVSFAAIEGLVGDQEDGATKALTTRCAALLDQKGPPRNPGHPAEDNIRSKAKQQIGRLYGYRNEVIHGRGSHLIGEDLRQQARRLAIGTLAGAIQFRRHFRSQSDGDFLNRKKDWLHSLDTAWVREAEFVGVSELSRFLPSDVPTVEKRRKQVEEP